MRWALARSFSAITVIAKLRKLMGWGESVSDAYSGFCVVSKCSRYCVDGSGITVWIINVP